MSAGMLRHLDATYAEELVAAGGAGWFHLGETPALGPVVAVAGTAADTRSMQAFFATASLICVLLFFAVSTVRSYEWIRGPRR
jgi:hypothetical protein